MPQRVRALRVAPIFGPRGVAKLVRSATATALRLAPCDLPKIDSNVAYAGFSTVS